MATRGPRWEPPRSSCDGGGIPTLVMPGGSNDSELTALRRAVLDRVGLAEIERLALSESYAVAEILIPVDVVDGAPDDAFVSRETASITDGPASTEGVVETLTAAGVDAQTTPDAIPPDSMMPTGRTAVSRSLCSRCRHCSRRSGSSMPSLLQWPIVAKNSPLIGLTRAQVIRAALSESGAVVAGQVGSS